MNNQKDTKTCFICKQTKPLHEFTKHANRKDGRGSYCFPCDRERNRKYREKNKLVRCGRCNKKLHPNKFYKDKRAKNGLQSWCKKCYKEWGKERSKKQLDIAQKQRESKAVNWKKQRESKPVNWKKQMELELDFACKKAWLSADAMGVSRMIFEEAVANWRPPLEGEFNEWQ